MNHPEHGWQPAHAAHAAATSAPTDASNPPQGAGPMPGPGYYWPGHGTRYPALGWPGVPPWVGYPHPWYGPGPHAYGHGHDPYAAPGYGYPPTGQGVPGTAPGVSGPSVDSQGFAAAIGNIADQAGLGMLKDLFRFDDGEFWKGAMVGAAVVLLLTNENLREALVGGAARTAEAVRSGIDNLSGNGGQPAPETGDESAEAGNPSNVQPEEPSR